VAHAAHARSARALIRVGHDVKKVLLPNKFYRQVPAFKSLYGVPFNADFVINSPKGLGLIEMKWQVSAGSVDEKLPFWLITLQQLPPSVTALLVAVGGGIRPGAMEWLRSNAEGVKVAGDFQEVQKVIRATW
jgi:hypothetical protein